MGSVLVFVFVCITLCYFYFFNHLDKERIVDCFAFVFRMSCYFHVLWLFSMVLCVDLQYVIVVFPDHILFLLKYDKKTTHTQLRSTTKFQYYQSKAIGFAAHPSGRYMYQLLGCDKVTKKRVIKNLL